MFFLTFSPVLDETPTLSSINALDFPFRSDPLHDLHLEGEFVWLEIQEEGRKSMMLWNWRKNTWGLIDMDFIDPNVSTLLSLIAWSRGAQLVRQAGRVLATPSQSICGNQWYFIYNCYRHTYSHFDPTTNPFVSSLGRRQSSACQCRHSGRKILRQSNQYVEAASW